MYNATRPITVLPSHKNIGTDTISVPAGEKTDRNCPIGEKAENSIPPNRDPLGVDSSGIEPTGR